MHHRAVLYLGPAFTAGAGKYPHHLLDQQFNVGAAISNVKVGEEVLATNARTGATQAEPVTALWVNHDSDLLDLTVSAEGTTATIGTTQHHLFYDLTGHRSVQAEALRAGDRLYAPNGTIVTVVSAVQVSGSGYMWDLTVGTDHDFYVDTSTTSVLVHSCEKIGANGTEFTSKTMTPPNSPYRVDVENPDPGGRDGQMHLQLGNVKYQYNFNTGQFEGLPNSLEKQLANDPVVERAIAKGLRYLGMR